MARGDGGGGTAVYRQTPVVTVEPSNGFNWSDAAIGAGIALVAAFGAAGILRVTGGRRRLASLLH